MALVMADTTIPVDPGVRDRLLRFGRAGETYSQIITRLLDEASEDALAAWMDRRVKELGDENWVDLEDV
jgi:hypothetical protein